MTYLIVLLPIFAQLASILPYISLGELLLIPFIIWNILVLKKFRLPKGILIFYGIPILLTLITSPFNDFFQWKDAGTVIARIVYYITLISVAYSCFNIEKASKCYFIVGMMSAIYLFMQVVLYYGWGYLLPIPRTFSEFLFSYSDSILAFDYFSIFGFRPASIFTEPSYYADYIAPLIAILLFSEDNNNYIKNLGMKKRIFSAVFLSITLLLSTSNMGVLYAIILWSSFLFVGNKVILTITQRIIISFCFLIIVASLYANGNFDFLINRLFSGGSLGARFIRGFIIFGHMDFFSQLFGIGLNNVENFVRYYSIYTPYDEQDLGYTITLTNRIITTGCIGLSALITSLCIWFKNYSKNLQMVLLIIISASFMFANGEYTYGFPFLFIMVLKSETITKAINFSSDKIS